MFVETSTKPRGFAKSNRVIDQACQIVSCKKTGLWRPSGAEDQIQIKALTQENQAIEEAKANKVVFKPETLPSEDAPKQLLATSRYLVFKLHRK